MNEQQITQQSQPSPDAAIYEIRWGPGFLASRGADMTEALAGSDPVGRHVFIVDEVIEDLRRAEREGARVVLLAVDSGGGDVQAASNLCNALLGFRDRGGRVVVFLGECAFSSAAWAWLPAADYAIAHPRSRVWIHGSQGAHFDQILALKRSILRAYTLLPDREIDAAIGKPGQMDVESSILKLTAREARGAGFVDEVGGRMRALEVARRFAEGRSVQSKRQEALALRHELVPEAQGLLTAMDTIHYKRAIQSEHLAGVLQRYTFTIGEYDRDYTITLDPPQPDTNYGVSCYMIGYTAVPPLSVGDGIVKYVTKGTSTLYVWIADLTPATATRTYEAVIIRP
jgi:ATP-dependent protease ClpP protease subunit